MIYFKTMNNAYTIEDDVIIIHRDLNELDIFTMNFIDILKKHSKYLIVSGYVSISTGRTRATEDVDVLVPLMNKNDFKLLFDDLNKNGFWCAQTDNVNEAYEYLEELISLRFAKNKTLLPNIELIPVTEQLKKAQYYELLNPQKIRVKTFEFNIPPLEFEILYKEIRLASKKDFDDAKHLRKLFSSDLKKEKFKEYEKIIRGT